MDLLAGLRPATPTMPMPATNNDVPREETTSDAVPVLGSAAAGTGGKTSSTGIVDSGGGGGTVVSGVSTAAGTVEVVMVVDVCGGNVDVVVDVVEVLDVPGTVVLVDVVEV